MTAKPVIAAAIALASAAPASLAHAEATPVSIAVSQEDGQPGPRWHRARIEGALGGLIGGQRIGSIQGLAGGLHLDAGLRLDRFYFFGEYDFLSVGEDSTPANPTPTRGQMHRFGGNIRYSFAAISGHDGGPVRGDFWAQLGAGRQHIRWLDGGRLTRPDLAIGLGAQATFQVGAHRPRFIGLYMALQARISEAPVRKHDMSICAGPCDAPTGPIPWDLGIFFDIGVPFGR
jgi:hypothetical protein